MSSARTFALVQARMSSTRLPGKVMTRVHGIPLLGHLLDRLERAEGLDGIAVATSDQSSDDAVAEYVLERGLPCHRGDLDDVAGRLLAAAERLGADHILRVSGDSPMLDPAIVTRALELYRAQHADCVTNVQVRTFPKGQSVEVFSTAALARARAESLSDSDNEHVTPYFYRHPERFSIVNFEYAKPRGGVQLSVDSAEDLARFESIMSALGPPFWRHGIERVLEAYDDLCEPHR